MHDESSSDSTSFSSALTFLRTATGTLVNDTQGISTNGVNGTFVYSSSSSSTNARHQGSLDSQTTHEEGATANGSTAYSSYVMTATSSSASSYSSSSGNAASDGYGYSSSGSGGATDSTTEHEEGTFANDSWNPRSITPPAQPLRPWSAPTSTATAGSISRSRTTRSLLRAALLPCDAGHRGTPRNNGRMSSSIWDLVDVPEYVPPSHRRTEFLIPRLDVALSLSAERGGFEPPVRFDPHTAFPVPHNRPLCHLSGGRSASQPHDTLARYPRQFSEGLARVTGCHVFISAVSAIRWPLRRLWPLGVMR